jgi:hypothetical protein
MLIAPLGIVHDKECAGLQYVVGARIGGAGRRDGVSRRLGKCRYCNSGSCAAAASSLKRMTFLIAVSTDRRKG